MLEQENLPNTEYQLNAAVQDTISAVLADSGPFEKKLQALQEMQRQQTENADNMLEKIVYKMEEMLTKAAEVSTKLIPTVKDRVTGFAVGEVFQAAAAAKLK